MLAQGHNDGCGTHSLLLSHKGTHLVTVVGVEAEEGVVDVGERGVDHGVVGLVGEVEGDRGARGLDGRKVLGSVAPDATHKEVVAADEGEVVLGESEALHDALGVVAEDAVAIDDLHLGDGRLPLIDVEVGEVDPLGF